MYLMKTISRSLTELFLISYGIHQKEYKEIKHVQHADDMTLTLKNINSLSHAVNTINLFCQNAGSRINLKKTECIPLGTLKDQYHPVEGIKVSKHEVKCLGIYIGHDKIEYYNQKMDECISQHRKTL